MFRKALVTLALGLILPFQGVALAEGLAPAAPGSQQEQTQDQAQQTGQQPGVGGADLRKVLRPEWYSPAKSGVDLGKDSPIQPVLQFGNWLIGLVGGVVILLGVWRALVIAFKAMTGAKEYSTLGAIIDALKPIGFGVIVVLLAVTGAWYQIFDMVWAKVVSPVINILTASR